MCDDVEDAFPPDTSGATTVCSSLGHCTPETRTVQADQIRGNDGGPPQTLELGYIMQYGAGGRAAPGLSLEKTIDGPRLGIPTTSKETSTTMVQGTMVQHAHAHAHA